MTDNSLLTTIPRPLEYVDGGGVYFLFREFSLLYVGMSKNVMRRIDHHRNYGVIPFDRFSVIGIDNKLNRKLNEAKYIIKLNPPYNLSVPPTDYFINISRKKRYKFVDNRFTQMLYENKWVTYDWKHPRTGKISSYIYRDDVIAKYIEKYPDDDEDLINIPWKIIR